ncbi:hypothetical protein BGW80DRAFT_613092 [Lactifluus volemus]|nr:hypothetical protein BGW80DRAFT_613092 [Lactifluus volemus]
MWRLVACVNFADAVRLSNLALSILKDIIPQDQRNALRSVEMGQFLRSQGDLTGQPIGLCAQSIVAGIISNVQESNDGWVALAADQLSKSEDVIRGYLERGHDNVLLANLTYIARLIFHSLEENRDMAMATSFILTSLPDFNGRNTLPELQDDFLALWKEIEEAPNDRVPTEIRDNLFNVYSSLTQGTVDASKSPPNPLNSTSPVYETVDENTQMHTNIPRPASHDNPSLATSSPLFLSPDSGHITVDPVDESSPGGIPQAMSHPTTVTVSSDHAPPRSQGASHAKASASTATADTIADTSSRKQSTIVPDPPSEMISTASSTTPATSVSPPHILGTAALVARHDARDLDDRAEMKSLSQIRQLDPSASNNRDPSENPA